MKFYLLLVVVSLFIKNVELNQDTETCGINKKSEQCTSEVKEDPSVKYNRARNSDLWNKYLKKINEAVAGYETCNSTSCSCYDSVLESDLSPWTANGIKQEMVRSVKDKGTLYQIIDHRLYRDPDCMFPFRCKGVEYFILRLLPDLPNMEFVLNTRDWPQIPKTYGPYPVFSFSKTNSYYDIMYPAWSFREGGPAIALYPTGLGRWDLHIDKIKSKSDAWPWKKKISKAFFRGSRTSSERDPLILLSRSESNLVDAQYTKNQAWKSDHDTLGRPPVNEIPLEDHCQFKYLFNYRGVAASFRFKHLFLCRSLVLHVGDDWQEFFYSALKPWVHYVPVPATADQKMIKSILNFLQEHDELAQSIAERGFQFIIEHLKMDDIHCYWKNLLLSYAKLLDYKPVLKTDLIEIR